MSGRKIIRGMMDALAFARGDRLKGRLITPSCGCVFCDLGVEHPEGVDCTNSVSAAVSAAANSEADVSP
jgi:hypothetical protein